MSVSLYKLSTVKWSTFIGFLNTDLLSFFVAAALLYFKRLFSFLFLFNFFFFLLQCIDVTWRGTSINCFLFGRLDRMIAPWGGRRIYFLSYGESLFFKASNPFPSTFSFCDTLTRSLFLIQFSLLSISQSKEHIQSISIHYFINNTKSGTEATLGQWEQWPPTFKKKNYWYTSRRALFYIFK